MFGAIKSNLIRLLNIHIQAGEGGTSGVHGKAQRLLKVH
jgi:hypothetical protein